jgi:glutathione S-transferase
MDSTLARSWQSKLVESFMTDRRITLFHAPNSRSTGTLILLEELAADYELRLVNFARNEQRSPAHLALNPMGKVPAILHAGAVVSEQVAIYLYLADLYADRGLAPPIGDPLRGPYLRWMVFYGSCFEPAIVDRSQKREPAATASSPYGDYETMLASVTQQIERGPYIAGDRFTAADVLWGIAFGWTTGWGIVPRTPALQRYVEAFDARPAVIRARARDAELATSLET